MLIIIWGFFLLVLFHSFVNNYFLKVIKKPIIEDRFIYRIIIVKKNANDITNYWYLWYILLCINKRWWQWIKGRSLSCWRSRNHWRRRGTSSRGSRRGLLLWWSRRPGWEGNSRIPWVKLYMIIFGISPILPFSHRRASISNRYSGRKQSKRVHKRCRSLGYGLSIGRKNCISWSPLNNLDSLCSWRSHHWSGLHNGRNTFLLLECLILLIIWSQHKHQTSNIQQY